MSVTIALPAVAITPSRQPDAGEIALALRNLNAVGSVLYVAAHPDDENTRLLAWLASRGLRAGYLSITRGDGGQNLIGTEQDELLGLIRTHELLEARKIDGAEQLFTRARDFGYSKSADETLRVWGKEAILGDVVLAIRTFRPDVVITRFTTAPPNHGHHTASAVLAAEAFVAAADPRRFPEQLTGGVTTWQADRLLQNVSTWNLKPDADLSAHLRLDVGSYEPLLGRSIGEIAALSRSQHKSQGFGVAADRGPLLEYFTPLARAGGKAPPKGDPFEGLVLDWRRFPGSEAVSKALRLAAQQLDPAAPHKIVPTLLQAHDALGRHDASTTDAARRWRDRKRADVERLIVACSGLFVEARATQATVVPGTTLPVDVTALLRSPAAARLVSVGVGDRSLPGAVLVEQQAFKTKLEVDVAAGAGVSTPYWLERPADGGRFVVDDVTMIGRPEGGPALSARFSIAFSRGGAAATTLALDVPVTFVWTDPVRGELSRPVEIVPAVTATFARDVVMVVNGAPTEVAVVLTAGADQATGALRLAMPAGYEVEPATAPFALTRRAEEKTVVFRVTPSSSSSKPSGRVFVQALVDDKPARRARAIAHPHIPPLTVRAPSTSALVPVTLAIQGKRIGYIPGPGDKVAESLAAVGYDVTLLPEARLASITPDELARLDAVVVGVRAFNAEPRLAVHRDKLLAWVAAGGHLVVQYNTNSRVGPLAAGVWPAPLEIGRQRVTDEAADVVAVDPRDSLWSTPNRLGPADFEGWVQERGLYFASTWDPIFKPMLSMHDPGEPDERGALVVARHGKGSFTYTGLAFFRQLPAGVPGAYRLLANVLAR